jgi:hypothetical protein
VLVVLSWRCHPLPGIKAFSKISAQWAVAIVIFWFFSSTGATSRSLRPSGTGARRASGWPDSRHSALRPGHRPLRVDGPQPGPLCGPVSLLLCGGGDRHVRHPPASAAGRPGRRHPGGAGIASRRAPLWGESGSRTFTAQIFAPARPDPGAAHRNSSRCRPPASPSSRIAADLEVLEGFFARRLDMSLATRERFGFQRIASAIQAKSGWKRPSHSRAPASGDLSGGDGAAIAGYCADAIFRGSVARRGKEA